MNPIAYALRALLVNEFNTDAWGAPVPTGLPPPNDYTALGFQALQLRGFQTETWCVFLVMIILGCLSSM